MSEFKPGDGDVGDKVDGRTLPKTGPGGIYHEKQIGALCAVHAMNNLMQSGVFNEHQLSSVAQALDREESRLLGGAAVDEGGNVRADGFFNVQVISTALRNKGYTMEPIAGEAARKLLNEPEKQRGFILNKREHWFALRRIGQEWFDLNSCLKIPRHFTDRELSATVNDAVREGYTVFVVEGNFPKTELDRDGKKLLEAVQGCGHFRQGHCLFAGSGETLGGASGAAAGAAGSGAAAAGEQQQVAAAAAASTCAQCGGSGKMGMLGNRGLGLFSRACNACGGRGSTVSSSATSSPATAPAAASPAVDPSLQAAAEADPDLAAAIAASLQSASAGAPAAATAPEAPAAPPDAAAMRAARLARFNTPAAPAAPAEGDAT